MEVIVDGDECIKEPGLVTDKATDYFREWFERIEKERIRDITLAGIMASDEGKQFEDFAVKLGVPEVSIQQLKTGFEKKKITPMGKREGDELLNYVPTLEEFIIIERMNPDSTGCISGLTYHKVQKWDNWVKTKVYEELKGYYLRKEIPKGWGDG